MKQCPACNRTYANDKQKFCTLDGASLIDVQSTAVMEQETVRIDSAQLDKEVTKVISKELPSSAGGVFDPYKTVVSTPQQTPPTAPPTPPAVTPPAPDLMKTSASLPPTTSAPPAVTPPAPDLMKTSASLPTTTAAPASPTIPPRPPVAATPPPPRAAEAPKVTSSAGEAGQVTMPPPTAPAVAAVAPPVRAQKKRSKLPLILGILFVLLLLGAGGVVAAYFFVLKPILAKKQIAILEPRRAEPTPSVASTPRIEDLNPGPPRKLEVPPYSPPEDAVKFVNSNAKLTGRLAEHFVDFTFYYPKDWHKDAEAGTANSTNFAKVQRQLAADAPQEIFAVGWYGSTGGKDTDQASYPRLVTERSAQFAKTYPEYHKVSEGPAKAGPYDAYEFRFTGIYRNTDRGDVKIWGRVMFVPPLEGTKGVTLLMLASSLAPEVKSVADVGVKGDLPVILESFRFGK